MPVLAEAVRREAEVDRLRAVAVPAPGSLVDVSGARGTAITGLPVASMPAASVVAATGVGPPRLAAARPQMSQ